MVDSIHGIPPVPPDFGANQAHLETLDKQIREPLGKAIEKIQSILTNPTLLDADHLEQLAQTLIALNQPTLEAKNIKG